LDPFDKREKLAILDAFSRLFDCCAEFDEFSSGDKFDAFCDVCDVCDVFDVGGVDEDECGRLCTVEEVSFCFESALGLSRFIPIPEPGFTIGWVAERSE